MILLFKTINPLLQIVRYIFDICFVCNIFYYTINTNHSESEYLCPRVVMYKKTTKMNVIASSKVNCRPSLKSLQGASLLLFACFFLSASGLVHAQATNTVHIDRSSTWLGYMNWSPSPYTVANFPGGGGTGSSSWGTVDLKAAFNGSQATLSPCCNVYDNTGDAYWVNPDGTGANNMDASFYVENDPTSANPLGGSDVVFSGYCWINTLIEPYETNTTVFIKEFTTSYGYVGGTNVILTAGQPFSIQWDSTAGDIVQYGFEMIGPDVNPATLATNGVVIVSSNPPPAGPVISGLAATTYVNVDTNTTFAATVTGGSGSITYQWEKNGINLVDGANVSGATNATLTLSNIVSSTEGNYTVVAKDALSQTTSASGYLIVFNPTNLVLDPNASLLGYLNFFDMSFDYLGGFVYPTALLRAGFSNGAAVLQPNIDLYANGPNYNAGYQWTNSDGTPNAELEQDFYIQNDALAGNTLTYNGYCLSNNLDSTYTATAWVEDFSPAYALTASVTSNLVAGQSFSITLPTTAGDHIQYGLRIDGPDNSPTNLVTQDEVIVTASGPSGTQPTITATVSQGTVSLSFATANGSSYAIQYKTNLSDPTWQTLSTVSGNGSTQTVTDPATKTSRFYRLAVQ